MVRRKDQGVVPGEVTCFGTLRIHEWINMAKNIESFSFTKESFLKDLVVVTGAPTSGKSMLAPIIGSLRRAENFKMSILLEHLGTLNYLKKIPDDALTFLLRYTVDFMLYDNMIGRNLNFRFQDETSIWNSAEPQQYFDRLLSDRGEFVIEKIDKERPLLVLTLSDAFWHAKRWFEAFPFMKMIYIGRHPVDMIYSWNNHRYGGTVKKKRQGQGARLTYGSETYNSKINQVVLTRVNASIVPYYALQWANNYDDLTEMDRIIYMIECIRTYYAKTLTSLTDQERQQVLFLSFDETVTKTDATVKKICSFLDTERTSYTSEVLKREKCPRIFSEDDRKNKLDKIKELATDQAFCLLMKMVDKYEQTRI